MALLAPRKARRLQKHHLELAALLARLTPTPHGFKIADAIMSLVKHAAEVRLIDEIACDRNLDPEEKKHHKRHLARCAKVAAEIGCTVVHHTDPRGYTIRVTAPGLRGNTWGGDEEGWGIV